MHCSRRCRLVLRPGKDYPEVTEVLARPKEFQPCGSVDPGSREGKGSVFTKREATGLVDVQLAVGGRAKKMHTTEGGGQVVCLEHVRKPLYLRSLSGK